MISACGFNYLSVSINYSYMLNSYLTQTISIIVLLIITVKQIMKFKLLVIFSLLIASINSFAQDKEVNIKIIETSDLHGNFFPYCFITNQPKSGSLSRISSFVKEQRNQYGDNVIVLDNGDILQGQPSVYYYNFIDTVSTHLCADVLNYVKFDAGNMGNHDIEAGNAVFDRWVEDCNFPILGANIIDTKTNEPYLPPYKVFEKDGVKVAVLGMITPAIPAWLPENLWKGLRFDDMEETARKWVPIIQEKESPDLLVGLFHAGNNAVQISGIYNENASKDVATNVPGFDVVFTGHDHSKRYSEVVNVAGDTVLIVNPGSNGDVVGDVTAKFKMKDGKVVSKEVGGQLTDMNDYQPDQEYDALFANQFSDVKDYVSKKIGTLSSTITTRPSFFGSSAFADLIHTLQLNISGAEVSLTAPLSFDTEIKEGDVYVSDMFNLYKYENMLYVMGLTGKEIKGALEESYSLWTNQMKSADDDLLLFREGNGHSSAFYKLKNASFNFDTAAGINYTVDVTKPKGEKINIISMADGTPFDYDKVYKVAVNSYRGNGGGEILTKGAGIAQEELSSRILSSTDKDLRYYLIKYIEENGVLNPQPLNQWKFIPEEWTQEAAKRDYKRLFDN